MPVYNALRICSLYLSVNAEICSVYSDGEEQESVRTLENGMRSASPHGIFVGSLYCRGMSPKSAMRLVLFFNSRKNKLRIKMSEEMQGSHRS